MNDCGHENIQMLVTIDGPAASGKTTTARALAQRLRVPVLESGVLYRIVALVAKQHRVPLEDRAMQRWLEGAGPGLSVVCTPVHTIVSWDGSDLTEGANSDNISKEASMVGALPAVRQWLKPIQTALGRRYEREGGLVAEGRDTGTEIFPAASLKFYLAAGPETRALRRTRQLGHTSDGSEYGRVLEAIIDRDRRDPMKPPADAIHVNTVGTTTGHIVDFMMERVKKLSRLPLHAGDDKVWRGIAETPLPTPAPPRSGMQSGFHVKRAAPERDGLWR